MQSRATVAHTVAEAVIRSDPDMPVISSGGASHPICRGLHPMCGLTITLVVKYKFGSNYLIGNPNET
jgi:hypothetical protein